MSRSIRSMSSMLHRKFHEEARLSSLAGQMLARLGVRLPVRVQIREDAHTASTDGLVIFVPPAFEGKDVLKTPTISVGLLAHEFGHFLQPLEEVQEVEQRERIPHWLVNVLLDIQGEYMVEHLVKAWKKPLTAVRRRVHRRAAEFMEAVLTAEDKAAGALPALLVGRFRNPPKPFTAWFPTAPKTLSKARMSVDDMNQIEDLVLFAGSLAGAYPEDLPRLLTDVIRKFPWLRKAVDAEERMPAPAPVFGTAHTASPLVRAMLPRDVRVLMTRHDARVRDVPVNARQPLPDAERLARKLSVRWKRREVGEIIGTDRLDRLDEARGHPVPYRADAGKGRNEGMKIVLAVDVSGSMLTKEDDGKPPLVTQALAAAQALSLAVCRTGGDVVGIVFSSNACAAPSGENILFSFTLDEGGVPRFSSLVDAYGGTDFWFLLDAWERWPLHRIVLFTDGQGPEPTPLQRDRERTYAVLFGSDARMKGCASKAVRLDRLERLPYVLGMLVPRLSVAT